MSQRGVASLLLRIKSQGELAQFSGHMGLPPYKANNVGGKKTGSSGSPHVKGFGT